MTKIPVGLAAGVWSDEVRPWVQHYLYDLKLKRIEGAAEHFDEAHDAMKLTARHLLGILAEEGSFFSTRNTLPSCAMSLARSGAPSRQ